MTIPKQYSSHGTSFDHLTCIVKSDTLDSWDCESAPGASLPDTAITATFLMSETADNALPISVLM